MSDTVESDLAARLGCCRHCRRVIECGWCPCADACAEDCDDALANAGDAERKEGSREHRHR